MAVILVCGITLCFLINVSLSRLLFLNMDLNTNLSVFSLTLGWPWADIGLTASWPWADRQRTALAADYFWMISYNSILILEDACLALLVHLLFVWQVSICVILKDSKFHLAEFSSWNTFTHTPATYSTYSVQPCLGQSYERWGKGRLEQTAKWGGEQIKKNSMGEAFGTHGREERCIQRSDEETWLKDTNRKP